MTAFGHAGFGSTNRRNQLRAQGQIGGQDPYGNQVRNAMQPPTMTAYQVPAAYQQASGQQQASTQANKQPQATPASGGTSTNMSAYSGAQANTPGTAQPIQPQSQGTPYGTQAVTGGGYPLPPSTQAITGGGYPIPTNLPTFGDDMHLPTFGDDMHTYDGPVSSPGMAQPIQPQPLGTQYGMQATTGGGYPIPTTLPTFGDDMHLPTFGDDMHTYDGPVSSPGMAQPIQPQSQGTPYSTRTTHYLSPNTSSEAALAAMAKEQTYQDSVNAIRGRNNAARDGLLGRYLGDGQYEYDYMLKGYGGDIDPARLSFSLVGSPKR